MVAIYFTALFSKLHITQSVGWIYLIFGEKVPVAEAEDDSDDLYDESDVDSDTNSDSDTDEEDSEVDNQTTEVSCSVCR